MRWRHNFLGKAYFDPNFYRHDMVVYYIWIAALCLKSFILVLYGFGTGGLRFGYNADGSESCDLVLHDRETMLVSLAYSL